MKPIILLLAALLVGCECFGQSQTNPPPGVTIWCDATGKYFTPMISNAWKFALDSNYTNRQDAVRRAWDAYLSTGGNWGEPQPSPAYVNCESGPTTAGATLSYETLRNVCIGAYKNGAVEAVLAGRTNAPDSAAIARMATNWFQSVEASVNAK